MDHSKQHTLNDYAWTTIHHKAKQLISKYGFTRSDYDDLAQEMALDLLERLPKFDPTKATYNTFVARVVERKVSTLIRHRQQEKRDYRREAGSLNDERNVVGEVGRWSDTIGHEESDHSDMDRLQRRLDINAVLARLPERLRQAAQMLMTMTIAQVARTVGVPRSTLYSNHLAQLGAAFIAHNLDGYLP